MGIVEIVALVVFPIGTTSFYLAVEQEKTPIEEKIGLFRNEIVSTIVMVFGFLIMVASGIVLFLYSWKWSLCAFFGTAFVYPWIGRAVAIWFWARLFRYFERD